MVPSQWCHSSLLLRVSPSDLTLPFPPEVRQRSSAFTPGSQRRDGSSLGCHTVKRQHESRPDPSHTGQTKGAVSHGVAVCSPPPPACPAPGPGRLAHPGIAPVPAPPGAGGRRLSSAPGRRGRLAEQRAPFFAQGRAHLPALARPPVPPGLGGTAPLPGRQQPWQPPGSPSRCRSRRRSRARAAASSRHRSPRDAQGCLEPGDHPGCCRRRSLGCPSPSALGPPARRTVGRRSTKPPRPMDRKLQLRHSEKNIPRAPQAAFCLLQIPEPDPFSLWV